MLRAARRMTEALRLQKPPLPPHTSVHFHRGPQGQAAPCFDAGCPVPRLDA
jgi:hypothetical protein